MHGSRRKRSVEETETIQFFQGGENETAKQCCWKLLQKEVVWKDTGML